MTHVLSYFGLNFVKDSTIETHYVKSPFSRCKILETPIKKTHSISNNGCALPQPLREIHGLFRTKRFFLGERNSYPFSSSIEKAKIIELAETEQWLRCGFEDTLEERAWSNHSVKEMVKKGEVDHFFEVKDEKTQYFLDVNIRVLIPIIAIALIAYSIFKSK